MAEQPEGSMSSALRAPSVVWAQDHGPRIHETAGQTYEEWKLKFDAVFAQRSPEVDEQCRAAAASEAASFRIRQAMEKKHKVRAMSKDKTVPWRHACTCAPTSMHWRARAHTHTHAHMHARMHAHTHAHTHWQLNSKVLIHL